MPSSFYYFPLTGRRTGENIWEKIEEIQMLFPFYHFPLTGGTQGGLTLNE